MADFIFAAKLSNLPMPLSTDLHFAKPPASLSVYMLKLISPPRDWLAKTNHYFLRQLHRFASWRHFWHIKTANIQSKAGQEKSTTVPHDPRFGALPPPLPLFWTMCRIFAGSREVREEVCRLSGTPGEVGLTFTSFLLTAVRAA